jgi:2-keto-4-pentenoate hydratase
VSYSFDDPRIAAGMTAQLALRKQRVAAGATQIGWKVGFGSQTAMQKLGTTAPLVGFLMDTGLVKSGDSVSIAGWTQPVAEPEVAVHIGQDLPGDADEAAAEEAIAGLSPAIELADLNVDPEQVEAILGCNVFQRRVIVGPSDPLRSRGSVTGLCTRVIRNGEEVATNSVLEANTGRILTIVRHVADVLARCGERLKAGQFIIAGSITPPLFLTAEDRELTHDVKGLGSVSVRFTHG